MPSSLQRYRVSLMSHFLIPAVRMSFDSQVEPTTKDMTGWEYSTTLSVQEAVATGLKTVFNLDYS